MTLKVGVIGSASSKMTEHHKILARALGQAVAEADCITITRSCPGFPLEAARGAKESGGYVFGMVSVCGSIGTNMGHLRNIMMYRHRCCFQGHLGPHIPSPG